MGGEHNIQKNVRGVGLLAAVLAAFLATNLHLEITRRLVGGEISDRLVSGD